tara:strand:- start:16516 stop:16851 length:336 start_codon:yes stop_codon:yes gene_type:complete
MKMLPVIGRLRDYGVATVRADFDGQGDSGEIHEITFHDVNDDEIDEDLKSADLEDYIYDLIESAVNDAHGDWVNNDGGYGHINMRLNTCEVDCAFYQRTVEEHDWSCNLFK